MNLIDPFLDAIRSVVRAYIRRIARILDKLTGGRVHPNAVTIVALLAHLPIAWLIADRRFILASILLVFFGLFDALDGALARLQRRESRLGMLLDSITDRMKEVIVYIGIAMALVSGGQAEAAVWAVAACGASVLVSYVNAWGETVVTGSDMSHNKLNRSFRSGLMSFDVRMVFLIVGLASGQLVGAIIAVAVLGWLTAIERLTRVARALQSVQD